MSFAPQPVGLQTMPLTTEAIQKLLDENQQLLLAILENQNIGKIAECAQYSTKLHRNLILLASYADLQPVTQEALKYAKAYPNPYPVTNASASTMPSPATGMPGPSIAVPQPVSSPSPQLPQTPGAVPLPVPVPVPVPVPIPVSMPVSASMAMPTHSVPSVGDLGSPSPSNAKDIKFWTADEHSRFIEGIQKFGVRDLKRISEYVGTRTPSQVRSHLQKYLLKLNKQREQQSADPAQASTAMNASPPPTAASPTNPSHTNIHTIV
eukprot:GILK01006659.1.p1 GENE.GILK01006659.1~~GILK01006659.1.p1  ORF type:complete len:265 (-),score=28.19 GILK01006659.1:198-992(-)